MNKSRKQGKAKIIFFIVFSFFSLLIIYSFDWLYSEWDRLDFATIVYQMNTPLNGTNKEVVLSYCKASLLKAVVGTVVISIIYFGIFDIVEKLKIEVNINFFGLKRGYKSKLNWKRHRFLKKFVYFGIMCFYIISIVLDVKDLGIIKYFKDISSTTEIFEQYYVNPQDVSITFPERKRNLILIYLESMESTYASVEEGGGKPINYIPELTKLANENINFSTNSDSFGGGTVCPGTGWTMGAIVGTSSGVPFKTMIDGNAAGRFAEFLPGLVTLGDILERAGYTNYFLCGSEGEFGGRQVFYETHGNYQMHDYEYAKEMGYIPEDYNVFWGYEDQKLFEIAKKELSELGSTDEKPFNYTMITVDTHHPDGYICDLCENKYEQQYANAIACSSKQVTEFVGWITEQPWYENTTVILIGDHTSMAADFWDDIGDYKRGTYNCFINLPDGVNTENTKIRDFTTLDYFPTILGALGVEIEGNRLGLGTNLFSDQITVSKEYGGEYWTEISKYSKYYVEHFEQGRKEE